MTKDESYAHDPLRPHTHDPNPAPPTADPTFKLTTPDGRLFRLTVADLMQLPQTTAANCTIVSTGHGTSGPFTFTGTHLLDLVQVYVDGGWSQVEVISADGFGNRVLAEELRPRDAENPILLAYIIDGKPMTRQQGLVRLIVPSEKEDALRQVKWIGQINITR
ncbi:MAG: molybdopterin-dependent oxidoreductase [Anaerolineae bacterium]